jgi:hypothetical protein
MHRLHGSPSTFEKVTTPFPRCQISKSSWIIMKKYNKYGMYLTGNTVVPVPKHTLKANPCHRFPLIAHPNRVMVTLLIPLGRSFLPGNKSKVPRTISVCTAKTRCTTKHSTDYRLAAHEIGVRCPQPAV